MASRDDSDSDLDEMEIEILRSSGHMPSAEDLRRLEEVSPTLADRLIRIAELEQRFVHEEIAEMARARSAAKIVALANRLFVLVAGLAILGATVYLVVRGFAGSAVLLGAINALAAAALGWFGRYWTSGTYGRLRRRRNRGSGEAR
ncbi:hypothetical protein [Streptomyces sp. SCL15-4]|uniref:hypothetical protein n=1 Tax=Streptomyces sp. SCL15-4 TaxID=2967221 RepID=UPI00296704C9|nr:hypothetical protein [Streptomyces sp. SCL15-4]